MPTSTSTASTLLLHTPSATQENLKHLYRTLLQQARLLSFNLKDPILHTSHRYLARTNLQPLLSSSTSSSFSDYKRIKKAKIHRRQLADANFGWEHSLHRSLSLAYARTGKLRRDAISTISPQPSNSSSSSEKKLRKKIVSPILQTLLTNYASMNGSIVKRSSDLNGRSPPPFLPSEDDVLVRIFKKGTGRRREVNAQKKFLKEYMRKVKVPIDVLFAGQEGGALFDHLETKAKPINTVFVNTPNRFSISPSQEKEEKMDDGWLRETKAKVDMFRSKIEPSGNRKLKERKHHWDYYPKDFQGKSRWKRRMYSKIVMNTPVLLVQSDMKGKEEGMKKGKKDPLGIRNKLNQIKNLEAIEVKVVRSKYGILGDKGRGEILIREDNKKVEGEGLNGWERDWLGEQGLI